MRIRSFGLVSMGTVALAAAQPVGCLRAGADGSQQARAEIAALEKERADLGRRLDALMASDPRLSGMPSTPVRIAVPTPLARELVEKVAAGFVDQVTLELRDIRVGKTGTVRRIVTLGSYDLDVHIDRVSARLQTSRPEVRFGENQMTLAMGVTLASGEGQATVRFRWNGESVADAACGDLDVKQVVTGSVKPRRYSVQGTLMLSATAERIVLTPRFPQIRVKLEVEPSPASWAAVQRILDAHRTGVCGFVLDHVDVLALVRAIVDRGFELRLPTEKIRPMAVPVAVEPTVSVRGRPVALGIKVGGLAITPHALWLGAFVSLQAPATAGRPARE